MALMEGERIFDVPVSHVAYCESYFPSSYQKIDILQEECAELIQALSKLKRYKDSRALQRVKEEVSHVLISSAVLARMLDISLDDIDKECLKKENKNLEG